MIKLLVFHDVLCCWCYVAEKRIKRLREMYPHIRVEYKVFPLGPDEKIFDIYFGSGEQAKKEILRHWERCREQEGGEDINVELMRSREFPYPYSMPPLKAVKAAELQHGMKGHERYYDLAQKAHLVECRNINDPHVLLDLAEKAFLDTEKFKEDFESERTTKMVMRDYEEAIRLGVSATPTVLINGRLIAGAVPLEVYVNEVKKWKAMK